MSNNESAAPKVAIIYLSYNSEPYWSKTLTALEKLNYPKDQLELIIVDNPHPEHGSSEQFLQKEIMPLSGNRLPKITLLPQTINTGFAKGNNIGIKKALELNCQYVYLHNQDGFMEPECLHRLVDAMAGDTTIGAAQSLIMLSPEVDLINSAGNALHYLGFGYCNYYRKPVSELSFRPERSEVEKSLRHPELVSGSTEMLNQVQHDMLEVREVGYASGASLLLRADLIEKHGALDEYFISYHEDLEYSLRLKSLGYKAALVSNSLFFHEYSFKRNSDKYYLMERNRFATLLLYYEWPTLLLLFPMLFFTEIGLLLFSWQQGWIKEKLRAYAYWMNLIYWQHWLQKRNSIQKQRTVADGKLLALATGKIIFNEEGIENVVLTKLANPLMEFYWRVIKSLL